MAKYGNTTVPNDAGPADNYFTITPHDSNNLLTPATSIYVGGAGNVAAVKDDGTPVVFVGVPAGFILPIACKRVNATGTTATDIVGLA